MNSHLDSVFRAISGVDIIRTHLDGHYIFTPIRSPSLEEVDLPQRPEIYDAPEVEQNERKAETLAAELENSAESGASAICTIAQEEWLVVQKQDGILDLPAIEDVPMNVSPAHSTIDSDIAADNTPRYSLKYKIIDIFNGTVEAIKDIVRPSAG